MPFSLSIGEFKGRGMGDRRKETGDREKQKTEQRKTFCQRIKALNMRIKAKNFKKDFKIKQRIAVVLSLLVLWLIQNVNGITTFFVTSQKPVEKQKAEGREKGETGGRQKTENQKLDGQRNRRKVLYKMPFFAVPSFTKVPRNSLIPQRMLVTVKQLSSEGSSRL
ncbi:hypothetical protein JWG39_09860 [Desulforhopalus vacuolatus]|uniref:hypothetical protein n=1 Tax=Desulforhopalus vacuolatus TaxID=40414 RepID=UPI001963CFFF|nr:hypothetical protein [Desulforhopalus vacuolatus]MBM9520119.1 hypothetical protein [Desulforhopalus vacuolatus]